MKPQAGWNASVGELIEVYGSMPPDEAVTFCLYGKHVRPTGTVHTASIEPAPICIEVRVDDGVRFTNLQMLGLLQYALAEDRKIRKWTRVYLWLENGHIGPPIVLIEEVK